jgi:hypothetical protein
MDERLKCKPGTVTTRGKIRWKTSWHWSGLPFLWYDPQNPGNESKYRQVGVYETKMLMPSK